MDVLGETREVLRNDALIVLFKLTKGIARITGQCLAWQSIRDLQVIDVYCLFVYFVYFPSALHTARILGNIL